ncbi:MAG: cyclic nucleotide-binding domain-containing protein [Myxococcales bacterium]|nr:cyclic nucleotide-binding domain-containing protein [Myxococcales bacterium]
MPDTKHTYIQRELFIRSFFGVPTPAEMVELLVERMTDKVFSPGDILYTEGDLPGEIFFVTEGTVELTTNGQSPWIYSGTSFLGSIDATIEQAHSRTARALTRVCASVMSFDEYVRITEDFFDFAKNTMLLLVKATYDKALKLAPDEIFPKTQQPTGWSRDYTYLDEVQRILVLRNTAPLRNASVQALALLAQHTIEERYQEGEILFTAGDRNLGVSFVADGWVSVHTQTPPTMSKVGPGWPMLGIVSFSPDAYILSATARTDVIILRIPHEDMYDAMEEHFALTRSWWQYIAAENKRVLTALGRHFPEVHL